MAMVVTLPCSGCKDKACLPVCPVECFHEDAEMLYVDPEECIDCGACVAECPVEAIFYEDDVPAKWHGFIQLNATKARECPSATDP
ncbi:indolepyruvate ferredoxin oxidoreductase subunit alpha [Candidatus Laterigemmans baculatus]|uniref:indolepyruvate ferredoxin oxidoreductase subunit alpha n=1 Tax=Candidatus Laterigemmans baculatus TaxID=2770505 RepID=UPI0013DBD976|nr:ferredoxin family protein [Candidatus Laterigemmans baculatus]